MTRGTPNDVKKSVRRAIEELGSGGGLIVEPDQTVRMPEENVTAFIEAAEAHGRY
jgi:hypothetical protein